ncbi:MAG: aminotransferase, partial [Gammaproteobacteria bacterium]|nr:aminotransferase [Gammaproteobacteria bacterium]
MNYAKLSVAALEELKDELSQQYETLCGLALSLDLTRGKPSAQQLDLSNALDGILNGFYLLQDGTDVRNYGGTLGISEARTLGGRFLDLSEKEVLVGGNSSLQLMYLYLDFAMNHGLQGPESAWAREAQSDGSKIKFLCPVPGYDRHFKICEQLDIEMPVIPGN